MNRLKITSVALLGLTATAVWGGPVPGLDASPDIVAKVEAGDIDTAAQVVGGKNLAGKGSVAWYHQSALVVLGWAEQLRAAGEFDAAQQMALTAIKMMGQGAKGDASANLRDRAHLYAQIARAYERFFGDRVSARRYYALALQKAPDLTDAKNALAAYDAEAARLQQMGRGGN